MCFCFQTNIKLLQFVFIEQELVRSSLGYHLAQLVAKSYFILVRKVHFPQKKWNGS